ncbi:hypothetical protein QC334_34555 [Streptomyces sp. DH18]|uniref:hypothetical protein n=1 Tax=Streptomyces sp. DH18 TaxID=3040126 RepID=UPI002441EFF0|nr:hypothetical protein [Streptomyces sp. DH18]MDG9687792.1 hypothetical protein [Streptomyces sp. DH18]
MFLSISRSRSRQTAPDKLQSFAWLRLGVGATKSSVMATGEQEVGQQAVSADTCQRIGDYRFMAVNARTQVHAVLDAAGLEPDEADELVCAPEGGAVAGATCWVEELPGGAPDAHGTAYGDGWDGAVDRALDVLVSTAHSTYRQRACPRHRVSADRRGNPPRPPRVREAGYRGRPLRERRGTVTRDRAEEQRVREAVRRHGRTRAFADAENVLSAVLSDPGVREAWDRLKAAETELGRELYGHLQPFQDQLRTGRGGGRRDRARRALRGQARPLGPVPDGHETSMEEPHWGRNSEGRPIAWGAAHPTTGRQQQ